MGGGGISWFLIFSDKGENLNFSLNLHNITRLFIYLLITKASTSNQIVGKNLKIVFIYLFMTKTSTSNHREVQKI